MLTFRRKEKLLNLSDEKGEVGLLKTEIRCGHSILLDVWMDMLMVGMSARQRHIVRMGLRVVPIQDFFAFPYHIAIGQDTGLSEVDDFYDIEV